jgi:AcrR family transcriptional regulator
MKSSSAATRKKALTASRVRERVGLSRERIASAALELVEREGLAAFSLRRLGQDLQCEAMSLYHHFPSKEHLLDAMVSRVVDEIEWPDPALPWLEQLRAAARAYRAMGLRRPKLFPYVALHRMNNEAGLRFIDRVIGMVAAGGLSAEDTARSFRALGYYLIGAVLEETAGYARGPSGVEPLPETEVARRFVNVVRAGPYFGTAHFERTFDLGLDMLLEGIGALAPAAKRAPLKRR